ncbi:hypothetical protein CK807_06330 [Brucella abortus]|nr:hypothetical protein CJP69_04810 [Brucella abortus]ASU75847.1 hypothetical protein CJP70_06150 [Brucella abortus]ASZ96062.1 hypothetical protein CK804_06350 [Brucella abortus]ATA01909.1 hypothetical protein CK808_06315 [Brucella abortus]ATA04854.1 hypothetical protein CK807_06330 [Brucella abortus]
MRGSAVQLTVSVTVAHEPSPLIRIPDLPVLFSFHAFPDAKPFSHFHWKRSVCFQALSRAKPLRTFAGNAQYWSS